MRILIAIAVYILLQSCQSKPSLEKYFVANSENKNFAQFDLSPSILNIDAKKLTTEQQIALKSFDKLNILIFKLNPKNKIQFGQEAQKIKQILKYEKYQQLMKFNQGSQQASVSYVGDEAHVSEFVIYGNSSEFGFGVIRVLGKDMSPNTIMSIISTLQNANIDTAQLKPLLGLFKK